MAWWEIAASAVYAPAVTCGKISILLFYLRLSPDSTFRVIILIMIFFVTSYSICSIFTLIFGCLPVRAIYDLTVPNPKCINRNAVILALSIFNIVTDLITLVLPMRIVLPLQMPKRQKVTLIIVFLSGAFVCASAIARTVLLIPLFNSPDYTWNVVDQYVWSFIEINVGIICASIPPLKPFFSRYAPILLGGRYGSHQYKDTRSHREGTVVKLSSMENSGGGSGHKKHREDKFGATPSLMTGTIIGGFGGNDNESTEEIRFKGQNMGTLGEESSLNRGEIRIIRTTELDVQSMRRGTMERDR
ncbi:hypothetical protein SLS57_004151 [Botryosphaeria dothidea]